MALMWVSQQSRCHPCNWPNCDEDASRNAALLIVSAFAALVEQSRATEVPAQKLGSRNILATVPERYCHIGIHTAGNLTPHAFDIMPLSCS